MRKQKRTGPVAGNKSKFMPGDRILLHGSVIDVREDEDGRTMITSSVRGWIAHGIVYLPEDEVEPDPTP